MFAHSSLEVAIGKEATDASVEYRDAERALFALSVAKTDAQVSLADILTVLPDDNGRAWTGSLLFLEVALVVVSPAKLMRSDS